MNKTFKTICRMSQDRLKKYLVEQLKETHQTIISDDGYIYAQGDFPVLLVAHMDTVHDKLPETFCYNPQKQSISSPQGIGGDDRCGIYMILEVIRRYNCSVLFCEDEEIGTVGAEKFVKTPLAKTLEFNYIIEFDRKGKNDAVFYDCDNVDFEEFITKDFYKTSWGSFSDISVVAPALGCAAVNLSCGYYNAHTKSEYVVMPEMENSINEACKILKRTTKEDKFEYIEAYHPSWHSKGSSYLFDDDYFDYEPYNNPLAYYVLEYVDERGDSQWWDTTASSEMCAIGKFCMRYPKIPYANIIDIYSEVM